jgi:hypothetical protein
MEHRRIRLGSSVLAFSLIFPALASAQQAVGIVTALKGKAQLTRAATQAALSFKDNLILRDVIDTQERSLTRILFGGKSTVTVRELSRLEVREELLPGGRTRTIHDLSSGSILVNVARSLMRRGDEVQIRTPNAVAAVRGSAIFALYNAVLARSIFILLTGSAIVTPQGLPPITLAPLDSASVTGSAAAGVQTTRGTVTQAEANGIVKGSEVGTGGRTEESAEAGVQEAAQLSDAVVEAVAESVTAGIAETPPGEAIDETPVVDVTSDEPAPSTGEGSISKGAAAQDVTSLLQNPGFEKGNLSSWTLTGAGSAVSSLGSIAPLQGSFMALIHTGTGSSGNTTSSLKQSFDVSSILLIKFDYNFLTEEFIDSSPRDDIFKVTLTDFSGSQTVLVNESCCFLSGGQRQSGAGSTLTAIDQAISGSGFSLKAGSGQTGFISFSKTVVVSSGTSTIKFEVADVEDAVVDSVLLFDAVALSLDPPLFLVRDGQTLVGPGSGPLIAFSGQSSIFDAALVACCPGPGPTSVSLSGPLLKAERSDLTVPFSMVGLLDGSRLSTTSSDPLVWLQEGVYSLSTIDGTAIFDFWGTATAVDPQTGVSVGTGRTVEHGGPLLQASGGATVNTAKVLKLDTALLEATAPVIRLVGSGNSQTSLTSSGTTIDLIKSKVTSLGPVIALDRGLINVSDGPLINLTKGSSMNVIGDLLSLVSGSKVNVVNGPLIAVSGNGSLLGVSGALVNFGGTGGNQIVVNNTITPTATLSGLPVSTANGGAVAIGSNPVKNPSLGTISVTGSLIQATNNGTVNITAP